MSKIDQVAKHLETYGDITPAQALELYGSSRLSSIIFKLRDRGMNIGTELVPGKDRFGNKVDFARYFLKGK